MRIIMPDKQKAKSLKTMAERTLERIKETEVEKYASNILRDYYEAIHELLEAITSLEGIKFSGEGAHEKLINYMAQKYGLEERERLFLQELRDYRNRIAYEGLFIEPGYIKRNEEKIKGIIEKTRMIINSKVL